MTILTKGPLINIKPISPENIEENDNVFKIEFSDFLIFINAKTDGGIDTKGYLVP